MLINPELLRLAEWSLNQPTEKSALVPPADPGQAGPPAGGPPMDPSMGGGAPPMDPSAMGGAPPMAAPPPAPMAPPAAPAAAPGMPAKPNKADQQAATAMDIFQVKKLMVGLYHRLGWDLPQDVLDGPNRDPNSGGAVPPGTPGSTSDPNRPVDMGQGGGQGGGGDQGAPPPDNAIPPIGGIQPASLTGAPKTAEDHELLHMGKPAEGPVDTLEQVSNRADAIAALFHSATRGQ